MEDNVITKTCTKCFTTKPLDGFGVKNGKAKYTYNRNSMCKLCKNKYEKERVFSDPIKIARVYANNKIWADKNRGRYKGKFDFYKWKNIGIDFTLETYNKLSEKQNNVCAICKGVEQRNGENIRLSVDHCHTTNKVRGLLCGNCNRALGLLRDNPNLFIIASNYLKDNT